MERIQEDLVLKGMGVAPVMAEAKRRRTLATSPLRSAKKRRSAAVSPVAAVIWIRWSRGAAKPESSATARSKARRATGQGSG